MALTPWGFNQKGLCCRFRVKGVPHDFPRDPFNLQTESRLCRTTKNQLKSPVSITIYISTLRREKWTFQFRYVMIFFRSQIKAKIARTYSSKLDLKSLFLFFATKKCPRGTLANIIKVTNWKEEKKVENMSEQVQTYKQPNCRSAAFCRQNRKILPKFFPRVKIEQFMIIVKWLIENFWSKKCRKISK